MESRPWWRMGDEGASLFAKQVRESFDVFDTDGSGAIDAYEMRKFMYNLGENQSLAQVDHILAAFDTDGDGVMDADEFAEFAEFDALTAGGGCGHQREPAGARGAIEPKSAKAAKARACPCAGRCGCRALRCRIRSPRHRGRR